MVRADAMGADMDQMGIWMRIGKMNGLADMVDVETSDIKGDDDAGIRDGLTV